MIAVRLRKGRYLASGPSLALTYDDGAAAAFVHEERPGPDHRLVGSDMTLTESAQP